MGEENSLGGAPLSWTGAHVDEAVRGYWLPDLSRAGPAPDEISETSNEQKPSNSSSRSLHYRVARTLWRALPWPVRSVRVIDSGGDRDGLGVRRSRQGSGRIARRIGTVFNEERPRCAIGQRPPISLQTSAANHWPMISPEINILKWVDRCNEYYLCGNCKCGILGNVP